MQKHEYNKDNILGLFDSSDLEPVESILSKYKELLDYDGDDEKILARIDLMPSIAEIINLIAKNKIELMSIEDRNVYFTDTVLSEKYI